MKDIVILCDGTWNSRESEARTSIGRLADAWENAADGPPGSAVFYDAGLGVETDKTGLAGWWDKQMGGAFGRGLTKNITDCFDYLIKTYAPGDRIFIFGYSRGAYTARSLAGLLRNCGVPKRLEDSPEAMVWYRRRDPLSEPDTGASWELRLRLNPDLTTSAEEEAWRAAKGHPSGTRLQIAYLGIFDTVGAHGIQGVLGQFRAVPGGHGFHDHELSHLVQAGRHALAIDETRVLYRPTKWRNLQDLNDVAGPDREGGARYQQEWFPGSHGIIGGSGEDLGVSTCVLDWIVEGARIADLSLAEGGVVSIAPTPCDPNGPLGGKATGFDPTGLVRWARRGPGAGEHALLHEAARRRIADNSTYRPASLRHLLLHRPSYVAIHHEAATRVA